MGKKDKKKDRHRSRSRSRERYDSEKKSKSRKRRSSPEGDSDSSSDRHRRHRNRSRSRDRHSRRSRSRSRDQSSRKHKKRSRSRERVLTEAEIMLLTEEKKKEKQLLKALETADEKRNRRLAKKELKERKRKANMGWDDEYMGYTNSDNPFGDEHLLDTFVWNKKLEKTGIKHLAKEQIERLQKQKMVENKIELEKVKKRRLEREKEREERDNEREMLQREKESEYYKEWEQQEDNFHLHQAKLRSNIRIDDGRAKPIDLLGKYIGAEDDDFAVEMHEPYTYLNGLTVNDLEDLLEDIKVYMELEQGKNAEYWRDITIIGQEELNKLRKMDPDSLDYVGERRSGINASVSEDINIVFKGKSLDQLALLEDQIRQKLRGGDGIDIGYWESLLQQLKAHMAVTRLRERHQEQLRSKLFKLKQQQGIESEPLFPIVSQTDSPAQSSPRGSPASSQHGDQSPQPGTSGQSAVEKPEGAKSATQEAGSATQEAGSGAESGSEEDKKGGGADTVLTEEDLNAQSYADFAAGGYEPRLHRAEDLNPDAIVYDPQDDIKRLDFARQQLQSTGRVKADSDAELVRRARDGMTGDEAQFSVEVPIADQNLIWSDKYRPRKPRFFNRVHTGFEWNKYNQTHYDIDNPPPKIVQGYKFNIFYPDLMDKAKTPEYILTAMPDNKDFSMLRFRAGPPYEDIAFKVVNREWEYSYKRGFRCQFHNNIFQLWFHFKRYRYRR